MKISAYLEAGLGETACDERLYIKYYRYGEEGTLAEMGTVMLQSGEYEAKVDMPLIVALADGRDEYPGGIVASEMVIGELKKFRMPVFLNTEIREMNEPVKEEKKEDKKNDFVHASGGVADINGSLGGIKKDTITLEEMQNMGNGMGDIISFNDEEEKSKNPVAEFEPDMEKIKFIQDFLKRLNRNIIEMGKMPWAYENMAAYLTGLVCTGEQSFLFHMGNLHLIRKKGLSDYWEPITAEHLKQVENHRRKKIVCCIGSDKDLSENMQVEDCSLIAGEGKKMALLGEGVYKYVDLKTLRQLFKKDDPPLSLCKSIAAMARENGSSEDISVVLFNF